MRKEQLRLRLGQRKKEPQKTNTKPPLGPLFHRAGQTLEGSTGKGRELGLNGLLGPKEDPLPARQRTESTLPLSHTVCWPCVQHVCVPGERLLLSGNANADMHRDTQTHLVSLL